MGLWTDGDAEPNGFPDLESYTWSHRSQGPQTLQCLLPTEFRKGQMIRGVHVHIHTHREGGQEGNKINNWGTGVRGIQDFLGVFVWFWLVWQLSSNYEIISK